MSLHYGKNEAKKLYYRDSCDRLKKYFFYSKKSVPFVLLTTRSVDIIAF